LRLAANKISAHPIAKPNFGRSLHQEAMAGETCARSLRRRCPAGRESAIATGHIRMQTGIGQIMQLYVSYQLRDTAQLEFVCLSRSISRSAARRRQPQYTPRLLDEPRAPSHAAATWADSWTAHSGATVNGLCRSNVLSSKRESRRRDSRTNTGLSPRQLATTSRFSRIQP
jgi:hypothetical protein